MCLQESVPGKPSSRGRRSPKANDSLPQTSVGSVCSARKGFSKSQDKSFVKRRAAQCSTLETGCIEPIYWAWLGRPMYKNDDPISGKVVWLCCGLFSCSRSCLCSCLCFLSPVLNRLISQSQSKDWRSFFKKHRTPSLHAFICSVMPFSSLVLLDGFCK